MKLAYWLRYYPTLTETFVYDEARTLLARGHQLRCLAIGPRESGATLPDWEVSHPPSYAEMVLALTDAAHPAARWLAQHQRPKQVMKALWATRQLLDDERIHCHFAGEAAEWARVARWIRGTPYVVMVHAADLYKPRPSLAEVLQQADAVLTISSANARALEAYGVQAQVVHCGVDVEAWPEAEGDTVLSVARNVPKKGLDQLVAAWPEARILGPGTESLGGEGSATREQVRGALADAGLFVLPCRAAADGDRDGIPVALMEAMACGLPVVTTDLLGLDELVDESVGWVVPPDDVDALRSTIRVALADPAEARRRGLAGRARVRAHFSLEAQADGVIRAHTRGWTTSLPEGDRTST
ncbi:MAG: glycosyltransferase family 4 protein [Proteobacteria bacterium]|nr:glycosyltransferase family 4 protein [Pseudomonadota bacterium]MCP4920666.1 glycosyltransferase family 4 protein [Pseudomonadota bacterium]